MNSVYSEMLALIRGQGALYNPPELRIARVKSLEPFKLLVDTLEIEENIYLNNNLVIRKKKDFEEIFSGEIEVKDIDQPYVYRVVEGTGYTAAECSAVMESEFLKFLKEFFEEFVIDTGDYVAVQKAGENFIVLAKVKKAGD